MVVSIPPIFIFEISNTNIKDYFGDNSIIKLNFALVSYPNKDPIEGVCTNNVREAEGIWYSEL